jgi:hypothetical protein
LRQKLGSLPNEAVILAVSSQTGQGGQEFSQVL